MVRKFWFSFTATVMLAAGSPVGAQERRGAAPPRLDVEHYTIEAEVNPRTQTLAATVQVRFVPLEDNLTTATFELNNALNVSRITDAAGQQVPASRLQQDFSVRLNFPGALSKGKPQTVTFAYDGQLTGQEESPVYGIKFAAIKPDAAFLLYPARWFPVNGYTTDRYTYDLKVSVPAGYRVIASGIEESPDRSAPDKVAYKFRFTNPSFPGSIAVVQGDGQRVTEQGLTMSVYFRESKDMAGAYGEETARIMTYLTSVYGLPPQSSLALVETEAGTPNGYPAPGILFLSPRGIGKSANPRLLANQVARQWWGTLLSPATRNHMWIENGGARYAELLYIEHAHGAAAMEAELRDTYIEALTVENPPLIQAARFEDYSPEYWATTAAKGAAVFQMLRHTIGDEAFFKAMKALPNQFSWKSITTDQFRQVVEQAAGQNIGWFFLQWIESSGAPEFKLEYTVFRTTKGFRVMGKVSQDLDTFRMPVELRIETEGNPEDKRIEVVGTSSEFIVETFGKPKKVVLDTNNRVLRYSNPIRVAVAIRRGEMFAEVGEFTDALKEYQKALDVNRNSSLAHYRVAEIFMLQNNLQSAANEFRQVLDGDLEPKWTEVWSHINLGKIFDMTGQRDRAVNEYQLAARTKDNSQNAQEELAKYIKQPYERPRRSN